MSSIKKEIKKLGYIPVRLKKIFVDESAMYHFLTEVELNGVKGRFIVDSGSTSTVVDFGRADKFGLDIPEIQPEIMAMGASPEELDVRFAGYYPMKVKKGRKTIFPVILMDLQHIIEAMERRGVEVDGILGADFMHAEKAVLDYGNQRLYVKKKKSKKKKSDKKKKTK